MKSTSKILLALTFLTLPAAVQAQSVIDSFNGIYDYTTGTGSGTLNGVTFTISHQTNSPRQPTFSADGGVTKYASGIGGVTNGGGNPGTLLVKQANAVTFTFSSPMDVLFTFDHINWANPPSPYDAVLFSVAADQEVSLGSPRHVSMPGLNGLTQSDYSYTNSSADEFAEATYRFNGLTSITFTSQGFFDSTLGSGTNIGISRLAAVPEPSGLLLTGLAASAGILRRRRRCA